MEATLEKVAPVIDRPKASAKPHVASLDAFRTIAALLVIFVHADFVNSATRFAFFRGTALAVDFFFVLSGFVIAMNYWNITGASDVWRYLRSRFARIYPLHLLTLLIFLGLEVAKYIGQTHASLASTTPAFSQNNGRAFVLNLLLLNAHGLIPSATFNGVSWSIGAEASCYLLFALIALATVKRPARLGLLVGCVLVAAVFFQKVDTSLCGVVRAIVGFGLGCVWWALLKGFVEESATNGRWLTRDQLVVACVVIGAVGAACLACGRGYPGIHLFSLGIIGWFFLERDNVISRGASWLGGGWFGQVSYGVYLWHPLVIMMTILAARAVFHFPIGGETGRHVMRCPEWVGNILIAGIFLLSLLVAHGSFKYFENPWRRRLRPAVRQAV